MTALDIASKLNNCVVGNCRECDYQCGSGCTDMLLLDMQDEIQKLENEWKKKANKMPVKNFLKVKGITEKQRFFAEGKEAGIEELTMFLKYKGFEIDDALKEYREIFESEVENE